MINVEVTFSDSKLMPYYVGYNGNSCFVTEVTHTVYSYLVRDKLFYCSSDMLSYSLPVLFVVFY